MNFIDDHDVSVKLQAENQEGLLGAVFTLYCSKSMRTIYEKILLIMGFIIYVYFQNKILVLNELFSIYNRPMRSSADKYSPCQYLN